MKTAAFIAALLFVLWFVGPTVWGVVLTQRRALRVRVLTQQTKKHMNRAVKERG